MLSIMYPYFTCFVSWTTLVTGRWMCQLLAAQHSAVQSVALMSKSNDVNGTMNKKLSYYCDSRSYCMQYFNAIYCDRNISSSE